MIIHALTFHINHSRCFLAAIEVFCLARVTPSIFYLGVCYEQRILYSFIQNCSIKFPQVSRFWESISLALQCYVPVNSHDCWVWSQNYLLGSICKETKIFTLPTSNSWCLALYNIPEYSKNQLCKDSLHKTEETVMKQSWNSERLTEIPSSGICTACFTAWDKQVLS